MAWVTDRLLNLHGTVALVVVFALPALESSAFVGFVFPGEIAVLLGGVLASQHHVPLLGAIAAAALGAAVGDSIGYEVGKRWGRRMLHASVGRVVRRHHLDRAERYLVEQGGRAVFLGRFTAALRVMLPGLAGMAGMPYRTFVVWNVAGAAVWATGFVLLGFVAGNGWHRVEHVAKRASLLLLVAGVVMVVVIATARWIAHNPDRVRAWGTSIGQRTRLSRLARRYERQLAFVGRRLDPRASSGLGLTLALVVLGAFGWLFGALTQDVIAGNDATRVDLPILEAVARHREPWLTTSNRMVAAFGSSPVLIVVVVLAGVAWRAHRRSWKPVTALALAFAGSVSLQQVVKAAVDRPRPPIAFHLVAAHGSSFPSGHATQATAVWGMVAVLVAMGTSRWARKVTVATAAILLILAVGASRVYLGVHWPTDAGAGVILGGAWLTVVWLTVLHRPVLQPGKLRT